MKRLGQRQLTNLLDRILRVHFMPCVNDGLARH